MRRLTPLVSGWPLIHRFLGLYATACADCVELLQRRVYVQTVHTRLRWTLLLRFLGLYATACADCVELLQRRDCVKTVYTRWRWTLLLGRTVDVRLAFAWSVMEGCKDAFCLDAGCLNTGWWHFGVRCFADVILQRNGNYLLQWKYSLPTLSSPCNSSAGTFWMPIIHSWRQSFY